MKLRGCMKFNGVGGRKELKKVSYINKVSNHNSFGF